MKDLNEYWYEKGYKEGFRDGLESITTHKKINKLIDKGVEV
jgi:flagellar biosynthesis/type III secretory pathway protein FliH